VAGAQDRTTVDPGKRKIMGQPARR